MTSQFLLAFGGTGSRCAEAVCYLAACGMIREPVHILVIDPDEANGNRRTATMQLERYHRLQGHVAGNRTFFSTPINDGLPGDSFMWGHPNSSNRFSELIRFGVLPESTQGLLSLLYDEEDLNLTFEQGYVGKAHIGSLDMYRSLRDAMARVEKALRTEQSDSPTTPGASGDAGLMHFFRALRGAADGRNARLAVVGSIFGGTGASGIPVMPTMVRNTLGPVADKVKFGCIQLTPYFSFPPPRDKGDPDSTHHPLAARAALYHYARDKAGYHRLYITGAPERPTTAQENERGGGGQRNDAHYVELAAALACADFYGDAKVGDDEAFACGRDRLDWSNLPAADAADARRKLVAFATFALLHSHHVADDLKKQRFDGSKFMIDLQSSVRNSLDATGEEAEALVAFTSRFLEWLVQTDHSTDAQLFGLPRALTSQMLGRIGGADDPPRDAFSELYARLDRGGRFAASSALGWYVAAATAAAEDYCASRYSWWRAS